jgi:low affinity Fe/Cu permease
MKSKGNWFERFSNKIIIFTGSSRAFMFALSIILIWLISGPLFKYSDTWQLVINTGTTIITFLMVFLIQKAQNKDGKAIQLKLDELIATNKYASNSMVDIECLTEAELDKLRDFYARIPDSVKHGENNHHQYSIADMDEADKVQNAVAKHIKKVIDKGSESIRKQKEQGLQ